MLSTVISSTVLRQVLDHAASKPGEEVCGLLFGDARNIWHVEPCDNVATDRSRWFELEPARLIAAYRNARHGGLAVIGHYHSHPSGNTTPSIHDAQAANADGELWLVIAQGSARLWKAVDEGAVHGRFEPVPLILLSCAEQDAPPKAGT